MHTTILTNKLPANLGNKADNIEPKNKPEVATEIANPTLDIGTKIPSNKYGITQKAISLAKE